MDSLTQASPGPQLPFDIWHHISKFIPDRQLKKLYSVNRALFHIAMSVKYRHISTDDYKIISRRIPMYYWIAQNSISLCQYIESLTWRNSTKPFRAPYRPETYPQAVRETYERLEAMGVALDPPLFAPEDELRHVWKKLMSSLTRLTTLEICWLPQRLGVPYHSSYVDTLVTSGWATFGSNLRSLSLVGSLGFLAELLDPSLYLERLESLSLDISDIHGYNPADPQEESLRLVRFIQKHMNTLQAFNISGDELAYISGSILQDIGYMPNLTHFGITRPHLIQGETYIHSLRAFLFLHRENLISISFNHYFVSVPGPGYVDWFDQGLYHMPFPNLQKLALKLNTEPLVFQPIEQRLSFYLTRFSRTLTSVNLDVGPPISFEKLQYFLDALSGPRPEESPLRELSFSMGALSATVFGTLAAKLPRLRDLRIKYFILEYDRAIGTTTKWAWDAMKQSMLSGLEEDFRSLVLDKWSLETLTLRNDSDRPHICRIVPTIEKCVAKFMPRLAFINGRTPEEYMQEVEESN